MGLISRVHSTIAHLITPRMTGAVHIIRISGEHSLSFLCRHTRLTTPLRPRYFYQTSFHMHPLKKWSAAQSASASTSTTGTKKPLDNTSKPIVIDSILCVYFKAPHSYTGEDVVELHLHGSLLIVDQILTCALAEDILLAEHGEFTYRAFLNGKLTLEQAEAIDTLIKSRSPYTRENALKILEQKASLRFKTIHDALLKMLAKLESTIEFPEEDIPEIDDTKEQLYTSYSKELKHIQNYFKKISANYQTGRKLEAGIKVAIIGPPNVGKSTLMNALLKEERALVSAVAGTTRDYIKDSLELAGVRLILIDTAGIRTTGDVIEQAGITKTFAMVEEADITIVLLSLVAGTYADNLKVITEQVKKLVDFNLLPLSPSPRSPSLSSSSSRPSSSRTENLSPHSLLLYLNKGDMIAEADRTRLKEELAQTKQWHQSGLTLSALFSLTEETETATQQVQADLINCLENSSFLSQHTAATEETIALLNVRQAKIAENIIDALERMLELVQLGESEEVLAEEFRLLNSYFAEMNLTLDHDKIYDTLFSQFCIGK